MASRGTQAHQRLKQVPTPQCHCGTKHCQHSHQHPPEIAQCHACVYRNNVLSHNFKTLQTRPQRMQKYINMHTPSNEFKLVGLETERASLLSSDKTRGTLSSGCMSQPPVAPRVLPLVGLENRFPLLVAPGPRHTPTVRFDLSR